VFTFILARLGHAVVVLFLVSIITFGIVGLAPGGPESMIDPMASAEDRALIRKQLGLDDPLHVQYLRWARGLIRGDFGRSFLDGSPVASLIADRLPNTIILTGTAFAVAIWAAVPAGVLSALRPYSLTDHFVSGFSFLGVAIPSFWFGIMLIIVFAVQLRVLPPGGMSTVGADFSWFDRTRHIVMPAIVLATYYMAELARYTRSAVVQVKGEDYVRTATAKGLPGRRVIWGHVLRNALIPVVTVIGLRLPRFVGGSAITESIFAWPGMGRLAIDAAARRDYPVVLGITIVFAVAVVIGNLLVDVLYGWLDPRIQYHRSGA
jgi:peptide/nickel transport system permease protein